MPHSPTGNIIALILIVSASSEYYAINNQLFEIQNYGKLGYVIFDGGANLTFLCFDKWQKSNVTLKNQAINNYHLIGCDEEAD